MQPSSTIPANDPRPAFDSLLEEAGDVVFRLNMAGQILFASRRSAAIVGHAQDMQGQPLVAFVAELDQMALKSALADVMQV